MQHYADTSSSMRRQTQQYEDKNVAVCDSTSNNEQLIADVRLGETSLGVQD